MVFGKIIEVCLSFILSKATLLDCEALLSSVLIHMCCYRSSLMHGFEFGQNQDLFAHPSQSCVLRSQRAELFSKHTTNDIYVKY